MFRGFAVGAVGWGVLCAGFATAGPAYADDGDPPFHILSSQDLCNVVLPFSEAQPSPAVPVGTICVRQGGVFLRLHRALPKYIAYSTELEPGKVPQLPYNSTRVDPNDPLSDWIIPD
jgi:hypothetical protein